MVTKAKLTSKKTSTPASKKPRIPLIHHKSGHYAFIAGILFAIIAGLIQATHSGVMLTLLVLGVVVGILNVRAKDMTSFLVAAIALIVAGSANLILLNTLFNPLGTILYSMLTNIKIFVAPAVVVVSLKSLIQLAEG